MIRVIRFILMWLCLVAIPAVQAELVEVPEEYEERYRYLLSELRCLVCQNQNLADSGSGLANDLRREVKDMMLDGATDDEILEFMSDRYGDFVLYKPPVGTRTYLLWFGPFVLLFAGVLVIIFIVRNSAKDANPKSLTETEAEKLKALTSNKSGGNQLD